MIIIKNSVFKRGAKLEIEKVFSKHLWIKIYHNLSFLVFRNNLMALIQDSIII